MPRGFAQPKVQHLLATAAVRIPQPGSDVQETRVLLYKLSTTPQRPSTSLRAMLVRASHTASLTPCLGGWSMVCRIRTGTFVLL